MAAINEDVIGANIRALREKARLSLTLVAKRAGLSKSTVSKIETGRISPPISTLMRIAEALDTSLAEFFVEPDVDPPFVLTRKGEAPIITRNGSHLGYSYEALVSEVRHKKVIPFLLTIKPGDPTKAFQHGGHEFLYMLSGRIEVVIGEYKVKLGPGDALYYDGAFKHAMRLLGKRPARFLDIHIQDQAPSVRPGDHKKSLK